MMKAMFAVVAMLALTLVATDVWRPKTAEEIRLIRAECIKESPLSDAHITQMRNFEFRDEEPVRQYLLCTALKLEIFRESHGYYADRLAKQFKMDLDEAEVLRITEGCIDDNKAQKSANDVWAFRGHQCLMHSMVGERVRAYIKQRHEQAVNATVTAGNTA